MERPVCTKFLAVVSVGIGLALLLAPAGRAEGSPARDAASGRDGTYLGVWPPFGDNAGTPWAAPAPNPDVPVSCGLDVGLLVDRSGSIERAGKALAMKDAARAVVDTLAGTPSHVGVWSFGASSVTAPGDPDYPAAPMTPVGGIDGPANVARLDAVINAIPIGANASTNWEAGFSAVHQATTGASRAPDLLIVLTDGKPTVHLSDTSTGSSTDVEDVDAAIRAANLVKADGTRVFAFGIGEEVESRALALVTDPVEWDGTNFSAAGYALTNFDDLADGLRRTVSSLCGGSLTVHKVIDDGAGPPSPGANWTFNLDSPTEVGWTQVARTDASGLAVFTLHNLEPVRVAVTETGQVGYHLSADEIACGNSTGPSPELVRTPAGVELELGPDDIITCTFPNHVDPTAPAPPPTTTSTTTSTTGPSTTTTAAPSTTTTAAPSTTTTAAPSTTTTTATAPPTTSGPSTTVSGAGVSTSAPPGQLPRTGTSIERLTLGGLALVFGGVLLVTATQPVTARRRSARR